jgi:site-specific recombinase XerD
LSVQELASSSETITHPLAARSLDFEVSDIALMRGYVQGLELRDLADRYIEPGLDLRLVKAKLLEVRSSLQAVARRKGDARLAALLGRDPRQMKLPAGIPTLEEYAARFEEGFYSETELLKLLQDEFGKGQPRVEQAQRRRERLIDRQLEGLVWLERLAQVAPQARDPVSLWFETRVARQIESSGISSLGDLAHWVNARGQRWWLKVPRIGAMIGEQVVQWLRSNEDSIGIPISSRAVVPARALSAHLAHSTPSAQTTHSSALPSPAQTTGVAPLESFSPPSSLDGRDGDNRHPGRCALSASNDYEAIHAWLGTRRDNPHTQRSYRKEIERFLLWCVLVRGKALSSARAEDCAEFMRFLRDPHPASRWVSERPAPRWSSLWRPFAGPLSDRSRMQSFTILKSMFTFLVGQRYLETNPFAALAPPLVASRQIDAHHAFTREQWQLILEHARTLPDPQKRLRMLVILIVGYATALRRAELAATLAGHLELVPIGQGELGWELVVLGKGSKLRRVPMAAEAMQILGLYFESRGFGSDPHEWPKDAPLIARLPSEAKFKDGVPLTDSAVAKLLAAFLEDVAMSATDTEFAGRLRRASAHWMRHSFGTHAAETMDLAIVRDWLGHASLSTTSMYINTERAKRHEAAKAFFAA